MERPERVNCLVGTSEADYSERVRAEPLDWYDLMLIQTFPASDALPLWW